MSSPPDSFRFTVSPDHAGSRLDTVVAEQVEHCSRTFAASLIRSRAIVVDGAARKPGYLLKTGETVSGNLPACQEPTFQPEAIPLDILYEDRDLVVINKAPGMVVHPAPGNESGTVANAVAHHCPDLAAISGSLRPGIVHRLDKETSGVLVVAKNSQSMHALASQFKARSVRKLYLALAYGVPDEERGTIDRPIGRHPQDRKKISVTTRRPRSAITHWRVRERFLGVSLLELDIRTGRTHQIRVHCQAMGHPLIGDPVYCHRGPKKRLADLAPAVYRVTSSATYQMLHARRLEITHPATEERLRLTAPLPEPMAAMIDALRTLTKGATV